MTSTDTDTIIKGIEQAIKSCSKYSSYLPVKALFNSSNLSNKYQEYGQSVYSVLEDTSLFNTSIKKAIHLKRLPHIDEEIITCKVNTMSIFDIIDNNIIQVTNSKFTVDERDPQDKLAAALIKVKADLGNFSDISMERLNKSLSTKTRRNIKGHKGDETKGYDKDEIVEIVKRMKASGYRVTTKDKKESVREIIKMLSETFDEKDMTIFSKQTISKTEIVDSDDEDLSDKLWKSMGGSKKNKSVSSSNRVSAPVIEDLEDLTESEGDMEQEMEEEEEEMEEEEEEYDSEEERARDREQRRRTILQEGSDDE